MIQSGNSSVSFTVSVVPPPVNPSNIKYGRLYNWYAASNPLFAPTGWHVPTQAEFEILVAELGLSAQGKLKETGLIYWDSPNEGATNEVGFNGKGSGERYIADFDSILQYAWHWSLSEADLLNALMLQLAYDLGSGNIINSELKNSGFSVRLIKDDLILVPSLTDLDGNIYRVTKIGNQVWLADNWACTKLNNGVPIPNVTDNTAWAASTTGVYCNYGNDISNVFLP